MSESHVYVASIELSISQMPVSIATFVVDALADMLADIPALGVGTMKKSDSKLSSSTAELNSYVNVLSTLISVDPSTPSMLIGMLEGVLGEAPPQAAIMTNSTKSRILYFLNSDLIGMDKPPGGRTSIYHATTPHFQVIIFISIFLDWRMAHVRNHPCDDKKMTLRNPANKKVSDTFSGNVSKGVRHFLD